MKAKWFFVILVMFGFPIAAYLLAGTMEKRYTASMRLLVSNNTRTSDFPTPYSSIDDIVQFAGPRSAQSQVDVLTGSNVLIDAIQRTALKYPKAFQGRNIGEQYSDLVKRLSFDTSQFSDVITLRVTMDDPNIAADTANNIGFAFIEFNQKMAAESGNAAIKAIQSSIEPVKKRMSEIDDEISKVKTDAGVADFLASISADANTRANIDQSLSNLKSQWEGAKSELSTAEASLSRMDKEISSSRTMQANPVIQSIDIDLAKLEAQKSGLLAQYTEENDKVREVDGQIKVLREKRNAMKEQIDAQSVTQINPNRSQQELNVAALRARESALGSQVRELQTAADRYDELQKKYPELDKKIKALERQRLSAEQSYQQLQQRLDLIESTGKGRQSSARIVSTAIPPVGSPSFPDTRLFIFFGIGLGVVVSAFILMPKGDVDVYGEYKPQGKGMGTRRSQAVAGRNLPAKPKAPPAEAAPPEEPQTNGDDAPPASS